jgi:hypothetical protein
MPPGRSVEATGEYLESRPPTAPAPSRQHPIDVLHAKIGHHRLRIGRRQAAQIRVAVSFSMDMETTRCTSLSILIRRLLPERADDGRDG